MNIEVVYDEEQRFFYSSSKVCIYMYTWIQGFKNLQTPARKMPCDHGVQKNCAILPSLATETDNRVKITCAGRCCTLHGLEGQVALHVFRNPVSTTEELLRGQLLNLDCFLKQWCFIRGVVTKGRVELASSQLRIILLAVHLALSPCGSGSFEVDERGDACQCWGRGGGESG